MDQHRNRNRPCTSTVVAVAIAFALGGATHAATIGVNDAGDGSPPSDGRCTLREALDNANLPGGGDVTGGDCDPGAPGSDTIAVPPATIVLASGGPGDDANGGGDLDLLDTVTILGAGAAATELVGSGDRVIDARSSAAGAPIEVRLIGLSLVGGAPPAGSSGGCLRVSPAATVLVDESSIRDCAADGGGGVLNDGSLMLRQTLLRDNRARALSDGGGVLNRRGLDVEGCVFASNHAERHGGAIANRDRLTVLQSELLQNTADEDGGAIHTDGDARSTDATFTANAVGGDGGAILHGGGTLVVGSSTFDQNFATLGGGALAARADWEGGELLIFGNRAGGAGGAVLHDGGLGTIADSELLQNNADTDGGAVHNRAGFVAERVTIRNNSAVDRGGAIHNESAADLLLIDTAIDENAAQGLGGGLSNLGEARLERSALVRNWSAGPAGGAFSDTGSLLTMRNVTVSSNQSLQDAGGLLLLGAHQGEFVTIARNEAATGGGGLWLGGSIELINSLFDGNQPDDCAAAGALVSLGWNVDSDGSCGLGGPGDLTGVASNLGPLQPNGGATETHALLPPSPSLDTAEPDCLDLAGAPVPDDQRRFARPEDGDGNGSTICDRGAYERVSPSALPRPVPDGVIGQPLLVGKLDPFGVGLELTWDVTICPSPGYHAVAGPLSDVSSWLVTGGACGLDPAGADVWSPSPGGSLWFVVVADDTAGTEGSWGASSVGVRGGATVSGVCGTFLRTNAPTCP